MLATYNITFMKAKNLSKKMSLAISQISNEDSTCSISLLISKMFY